MTADLIGRARVRGVATRLLLCASATTIGCVANAHPAAMTATPERSSTIDATHPGFARVRVGTLEVLEEPSMLSRPGVTRDALRTALEGSLRTAGYLAADTSTATFALSVHLVLEDPRSGGTLVGSIMHYRATNTTTGGVVFDDVIRADGRSTTFIGVRRVRLADEAAVRANIEAFLERFGKGLTGVPAGRGGSPPG